MNALAPRVSRDEAWRRLHRRGIVGRLSQVVRQFARGFDADCNSSTVTGSLPRLETIWLPYHHVIIELRGSERLAIVEVLVDAHSGRANLTELSSGSWIELPKCECWFGKLTDADAETAARDCVVRALLSRPGWGKRPAIESIRGCEPIGYPVWAYYFANRAGMLDAKLLDAVTGANGGPRLKTSLLATLAARQRI